MHSSNKVVWHLHSHCQYSGGRFGSNRFFCSNYFILEWSLQSELLQAVRSDQFLPVTWQQKWRHPYYPGTLQHQSEMEWYLRHSIYSKNYPTVPGQSEEFQFFYLLLRSTLPANSAILFGLLILLIVETWCSSGRRPVRYLAYRTVS